MKYLTKDQIEIYKKAHNHFENVVYRQYKLATSSSLDNELADIYDEINETKIRRNWACNRCCYNAYLQMGRLYFDSLKYWEDKDKEQQKEEVKKDETKPTPKKAGRPKKK